MPRPQSIEKLNRRKRESAKQKPKSESLKGKVADAVLKRNQSMNSILINNKTTIGGIGSILSGLALIANTLADGWQSGDFDAVSGGVGLVSVGLSALFARDADKTSQDNGLR